MNILLISRGLPEKQDPQYGNFELDQAKALVALGHNVTIASVDTRFRFYWRKWGVTIGHIDSIHTYNIFVCPSAIIGLLGKRIKAIYVGWLWKTLERHILQNEPRFDVIYSHYLTNTYNVVHYFRHIHAPIVAIEHWSEINKPVLRPEVQKMGDETYPHVNQLLTVSNAARQSIKQHFNKESQVVYNMVSDRFVYSPHTSHHNQIRFISTGSLIQRKGFDVLIHAFAQLNLPKDTWDLTIIGGGPEKSHLEKLIAKAKLEQQIHLIGRRASDEMVGMLNDSDVFVLPSRMETFGVVYAEALACGLPVIATPCGGPEEFVNKKNGLLVPVDDIEALAAAIRHMYEHHRDYNRQAIAEDCQARFSSEVIARQLTKIFDEVINKP